MTRKFAKFMSLALVSAVLIGSVATMTGCKKKGTDRATVAEDSPWYDVTKIELESPYSADEVSMIMYSKPVYVNGDLYVLLTGERTFDAMEAQKDPNFDYNQYIINSICKYDLEGNLLDQFTIENTTGVDAIEASAISVQDDKLKVTCLGADVNSNSTKTLYAIVDPASGEVEEFKESPVSAGQISQIENEVTIGDNIMYVVYDYSGDSPNYLLEIANGDNVIKEIDVSKELGKNFWNLDSFVVLDDHTVVMSAYGDDSNETLKLDTNSGSLTIQEEALETDGYYFALSQDGCSYSVDSEGIWKISENLTVESVMDFSAACVNVRSIASCDVTYLDDNMIILFGTEYSSSIIPDSTIYILNKAEKNPNAGKYILDVYSLEHYISYSEGEALVKFNSTNDSYYAVLSFAEDYEDLDEISSISDQLMVDIMAGDGPDIVLNGASFSQLNNAEYFVDLNKFIDGDNGLDKSQYYQAIFDAATNKDGAMYQIPVTFEASGILARKSDVGEGRKGFTYDQYVDFVDKVCNGNNPIQMEQTEFVIDIIANGYVDYETDGKVNFDTPEFRELAEFAKENIIINPEGDDDEGMMFIGGSSDALENGAMAYSIYSPSDFYYLVADQNESVGLFGYPASTECGPVAKIDSSAAISANVDEDTQAAAWDFIKAMLSEDVQSCETISNPMNIAASKTVADNAITMYNEQYYLLVNMGMNEAMLKMYGVHLLDDSVAQDYLDVLSSVETIYAGDTAVGAIVTEEMGAYFADQKSIDQVIQTLNDRAQTVVNERASA